MSRSREGWHFHLAACQRLIGCLISSHLPPGVCVRNTVHHRTTQISAHCGAVTSSKVRGSEELYRGWICDPSSLRRYTQPKDVGYLFFLLLGVPLPGVVLLRCGWCSWVARRHYDGWVGDGVSTEQRPKIQSYLNHSEGFVFSRRVPRLTVDTESIRCSSRLDFAVFFLSHRKSSLNKNMHAAHAALADSIIESLESFIRAYTRRSRSASRRPL